MKTTHYAAIAITLTLLASGCSKHHHGDDEDEETLAMEQPMTKNQSAAPSDMHMNHVVQDGSGKTVLYWYDPMKSDKHFDKPGKSPFMDMQLIPKYAEDADKGSQP